MKDMLMTAIAMVAVVSLAGCSANADLDTNTPGSNEQEETNVPVSFNSYLAQSKTTRAGETTRASEMTTTELQNTGFGVVAYYTGTDQYTSGTTKIEPNFMYNTQVSGSNWTYSPTVYWPNGGTKAGEVTPKEDAAYVSFFAYAPYKPVNPSTGTPTTAASTGITALSSNATTGDPTVSYTLGATGTDADLLIGTAGGDGNGNTTSGAKQSGTQLTNAKCSVNANMTKMVVSGKVKFNFKHALAKFGGTGTTGRDNKTSGLMIEADIDDGTATTGGKLDANTKITVKSISIKSVKTGTDGKMVEDASIPTSGTLNLATGVWTADNKNMGKIAYEINSPKATATKGAISQTMKTTIAEPASVTGWDALPAGVTTDAQSVYTEETPLLIIPDGENHTFRVTIDYIVRTRNSNLAKGYTEVEQSFYKDLTLSKVTMNAKYNLLIHLGLTSVKFDADVSSWDNTVAGGTTTGTTESSDPIVIYMPQNVASSTTSTSGN